MNKQKMMSAALSAVLAFGMAAPTFAAGTPVNSEGSTSIPVTINAEATTFNVTLPTGLPTTVNPGTGETTGATDATITNDSSGRIRVSKIQVIDKKNAEIGAEATGWHLKDFDNYDFHNADVDSNGVGISVKPRGGYTNAGESATALKTNGSDESVQTLLNYEKGGANNTASANEWVLAAKDGAEGGRDELNLKYETKATAVSQTLTNHQVASIIITVAWDKG